MKVFIFLIITLVLAHSVNAGGEPNSEESFICVSTDTIINGFFLEPVKIYPFSPVVYIEFNLPESSMVTLFVTDTLKTDTAFLCRQESMGPGLYKTPPGAIRELGKEKEYRIIDVHLSVHSRYGSSSGLSIKSSFEAIRRMAFR